MWRANCSCLVVVHATFYCSLSFSVGHPRVLGARKRCYAGISRSPLLFSSTRVGTNSAHQHLPPEVCAKRANCNDALLAMNRQEEEGPYYSNGNKRHGEVKSREPLCMLPELRCSNVDFQAVFPRRFPVQSMPDTASRFCYVLARAGFAQWVDQLRLAMGAGNSKLLALLVVPTTRSSDFDSGCTDRTLRYAPSSICR